MRTDSAPIAVAVDESPNAEIRGRIGYLCLQATHQGQASFAHVHEIIHGLERRNWSVELYQPSYASRNDKPGVLGRLIEFARVQLRLCRNLNNYDLVYVRGHFATFPTFLVARLARKPVVREINGPYQDLFIAWPATRWAAPLFRSLMRAQHRWADALIAVTPQLSAWAAEQNGGRSPVFTISNGADTDLFTPHRRSSTALPDSFVVFFGALARWQGVDTFLEAVVERVWPEEVKLVVLGDGAEQHKIERAAARGDVIYMGTVPYADIAGIVAQSLCGISPQTDLRGRSSTGLFPLKLFETMACGVPVIVSDFPGQADLVRETKCGLVIPPGDASALAQAVRFLFENPQARIEMGRRGRAAVVEHHSWDRRAADTERVLVGVLGNR